MTSALQPKMRRWHEIPRNKVLGNAEPDDSYDTPMDSYLDIVPYVPTGARILDPFYNTGQAGVYMKKAFKGCKVIHRNVDAFTNPPDPNTYDIIITNPPFSRKFEALKMIAALNKPFLLLMPSSVLSARRFREVHAYDRISVLVPNHRYRFEKDGVPMGAPSFFSTFWFARGFERLPKIVYLPRKRPDDPPV